MFISLVKQNLPLKKSIKTSVPQQISFNTETEKQKERNGKEEEEEFETVTKPNLSKCLQHRRRALGSKDGQWTTIGSDRQR